MSPEVIPILAVLVAIGLLMVLKGGGKKKAKPTPAPKPLPQPSGWRFLHCHGMPNAPTQNSEGCSFDFPQAPSSVHYLVKGNTAPLNTIAASFTVTGDGFIPQEAPDERALVSLIVYVEEARYYSRNSVKLAAGTFTLAASEWITVDGKLATPVTPDQIGLVFGHEAGRGHGVYATQPSQFILTSMLA